MIRASMFGVIRHLRTVTDAAIDDVFHGVEYWSDEQLQEILDRFATYETRQLSYDGVGYNMSLRPHEYIEDDITVYNKLWQVIEPVNYLLTRNRLTLLTELEYPPVCYRLILLDMNAAAAEVWNTKAAHRAQYIQQKVGQHSVMFQQEYQHCVERANFYAGKRIKKWHTRK